MTGEIEIWVNGASDRVAGEWTVADLVASKDLRPEQVAVEVNRAIVPRAEHPATRLRDGDRVEIVTMVGGG
ncbi:MAG: sulfur carrier protein ThiS [Planctomycetota bacterium]